MMLNSDQHAGREEINPSTLAPAQNVMAQENNSTYLKSEKNPEIYLKSKTICSIIHYKCAIFILFLSMLF